MNIAILNEQFKEFRVEYPGLQLIEDPVGVWRIRGILHLVGTFEGQEIEDKYEIELIIPDDYPKFPPIVFETAGRIPKNYHHYLNESLCLGAPVEVRLLFNKYPTLLGFTKKCLIPYLYRYSYKSLYGSLPYGELAHGWPGLLKSYQKLFEVDERKAVLGLLKILAEDNYRGHSKCPCGSRKKLRDCHGNVIRKLLRIQPTEAFKREFDQLVNGVVNESKFRY